MVRIKKWWDAGWWVNLGARGQKKRAYPGGQEGNQFHESRNKSEKGVWERRGPEEEEGKIHVNKLVHNSNGENGAY